MAGVPARGAYIAEIIEGQEVGNKFLRNLNDCTPPDALADLICSMSNGSSRAKLRGLCRALQKHLERSLK